MPIEFPISHQDILRGRQGKPGWYTLNVNSVTKAPGKKDPTADVVTIVMTIKDGPDQSVIGAPVNHTLSEKAPGMAIPFIEAISGRKIPEGGAVPDVEQATGRDIKAYLNWDIQWKNWKCSDFMPANGQPPVAA